MIKSEVDGIGGIWLLQGVEAIRKGNDYSNNVLPFSKIKDGIVNADKG